MSNDCIAQTWYRFVRMIGSPSALCCPQVISHTPQFMQYVLLRDDSIEPYQHPCLLVLPQIFLKAMKGIASQVDAFLGKFRLLTICLLTHGQHNSFRYISTSDMGRG